MGDQEKWKVSLNAYHSNLRTGIFVEGILQDLQPQLTAEEYACIEEKKNNIDRVDELVRVLLTKDHSTFHSFCSALTKSGYSRWASRLTGKAIDAGPTSQGGFLTNPSPQQKSAQATGLSPKALYASFKGIIQKLKGDCPVFGVLVVGETGTGKSTLVNSLMGKYVVEEGHTLDSQTATITKHTLEVEGVTVALYDTPGLGDTRGTEDDAYLDKMKDILKGDTISLVIYCLKLSETRMRASLIRTFQEFNKIGVKWEKTVIALTFADALPVPYAERQKAGFEEGGFFNDRLAEMQLCIKETLRERVKVAAQVASDVSCRPSTSDPKQKLVNGDRWFVPFWLEVLELLSPGAAMQFLEMRANSIDDLKLNPKEEESLAIIMKRKIIGGARVGAFAGGIVGVVGGPFGIAVGAGIGAGIGSGIGGGVELFKSLFSKKKQK